MKLLITENQLKQLLTKNLDNTLENINEITSDEAWEKIYSDTNKFPYLKGNKQIFDRVDALYPKKNNQFNKGYFSFLYNLIKNNELKDEDSYKAKQYLALFNMNFGRLPKEKRNILQFKNLPDLYDAVAEFENGGDELQSKTQELKSIREKEIDRVYEDSQWKVLTPKTERASCLIGKGTQWCTAADKSDNRFDSYNRRGKLYVLINKDDDSKYQIHFEDEELMDSRNRPISGIDFFEHIVEDFDLVNWFEENIPTFYDFILATSSEDMSSGGYSEMFMDALSNGSEYAVEKSLDTLRNGDSEDGVTDGFLYEKDPYNIKEYQISNYIENFYDTEMFQRVIEHLKEIGVDFDDVRDGRIKIFLRGLDELKKHKLEIDTEYKIDKNRILRIKSIDTEKDYPRYMIRIDGTDGLVPIDTLLSYLNNKSLFENQLKQLIDNKIKLKDVLISKDIDDINGNKNIGNELLVKECKKYNTPEELLRSGGFSDFALDLAAFGFTEESVKVLSPKNLHIKWKDDLENVYYEINHSKLSPLEWSKKINLSEPVDVSFDGKKFYLEDGHHRYFAAKTLKKKINVKLEIKANPIKPLSNKGYDQFHIDFFNQCKNTLTEQSRRDYLKWKRKNVTLRGIFEFGKENKGGGRFGSGLYTAFLSNKDMAKIYGKVYFVLNAIPKTPKVVNDANLAEMFLQGIINNWCKSRGMSYNSNEFFKHTDIRTEMLNLGYDGLVIKGREMVNYTPPDNVKYFEHEFELENYYNQLPNQLSENTNIKDESLLTENRYKNKNHESDFNIFMNRLLNQYDYDKIYLSFRTSMNVTKINIKNEYNTPTGIYTYKISRFFKKKDNWDLNDFYGNSFKFPFASGYPFLHFYVLKDDANILSNLTDKSIFDNYVLNIKKIFKGNKEIEAKCDGWLNGDEEYLYTDESVCYYFWLFLYKDILGGKKSVVHDGPIGNTNIRFTNLCNKLGIDGFNDNGEGFIHVNEKTQTVFFKPNLFKKIEVFITPGGFQKYIYGTHPVGELDNKVNKPNISIDIKNIRTIINKYGIARGVYLIVKDFDNSGDKEIQMYDNVFKDAELGEYFIRSCVKKIPSSKYPIKLINVIVKNGFVNYIYDIDEFFETLKMDDPLFEHIISIPKIKYKLSLKEIIKYNIKHNISLDFIYNLNFQNLNYMYVALLINNADDSEKMLRFLIPVIKKMNHSYIIGIYELINSDLGKLMFKLLDIKKNI
jgi:hypothetical protein